MRFSHSTGLNAPGIVMLSAAITAVLLLAAAGPSAMGLVTTSHELSAAQSAIHTQTARRIAPTEADLQAWVESEPAVQYEIE